MRVTPLFFFGSFGRLLPQFVARVDAKPKVATTWTRVGHSLGLI